MFLPLPPLLLNLLLFLQLLCDPGLPHRLLLCPLVRLQVQSCLESGGPTGTVQDLATQLFLEVKETEGSQLYHGLAPQGVCQVAREGLQFLDTVGYASLQPGKEKREAKRG